MTHREQPKSLLIRVVLAVTLLAAGAHTAPAVTVKVMTSNIRGTISESSWNSPDAQKIGRIANYYEPDVIGMNECAAGSSEASRQALAQNLMNWANAYLTNWPAKYVYVSTLSDGYNRNCLISRHPMYNFSDQPLDPRGMVGAMIDLPGPTDVRVYSAHLKAYADSSSAQRRQNGANTYKTNVINWSQQLANATIPYFMTGDMNEDEENPQYPLSSSYHPITTLLEAYVNNYRPDDGWGNTKTITSTSPTRRFDYVLPSWHVKVNWTNSHPLWSRVINTSVLFAHGQLPPGLQRLDSQFSDHLCVIGSFDILDNKVASARRLPHGEYVALAKKNVTASFGDHFYIQDPDAPNGIRVNYSSGCPAVNSVVNVMGTMSVSPTTEDAIAANGVRVLHTIAGATKPIALCNRDINPEPYYDRPATDSRGPINGGLLVKTWGKVQSLGTGFFYIHDGGGYPVRVESTKAVAVGDLVTVVGVIGYRVEGDRPERFVRTRTANDVEVF